MRVAFAAALLLIAIAFAVGIDAKHSSTLHAEKLSKALGKALKHHTGTAKLLKSAGAGGSTARRFAALQQEIPTIPCDASGFQAAIVDVYATCTANGGFQTPDIDNFNPDNATDMARLDGLCASGGCAGKIAAVLNNAAYMKCLGDFDVDFAAMPLMMNVLCAKEDNKFCAFELSEINPGQNCNFWARNASECTSRDPFCAWDDRQRYCTVNTTKSLERVCTSTARKCVTRFGTILRASPVADEDITDLLETFDIACHQFSGRFCAPVVAEFGDENPGFVCNDRLAFGCMSTIAPKVHAQALRKARNSFYECVRVGGNQTTYVDKYCKPNFKNAVEDTAGAQETLGHICARNARGTWCMTAVDSYETLWDRCIDQLYANGSSTGSGVCNSRCNTDVATAIDELGCCIGTMIAMERGVQFDATSYPPYVAAAAAAEAVVEVVAEQKGRAMNPQQVKGPRTPIGPISIPKGPILPPPTPAPATPAPETWPVGMPTNPPPPTPAPVTPRPVVIAQPLTPPPAQTPAPATPQPTATPAPTRGVLPPVLAVPETPAPATPAPSTLAPKTPAPIAVPPMTPPPVVRPPGAELPAVPAVPVVPQPEAPVDWPTFEKQIARLRICSSVASRINATIDATCPRLTEVTTVDPCYSAEFRALNAELDVQCGKVDIEDILYGEYSSDATANAGYAQFCNSSCASTATRLMSRYQRCLNTGTISEIRSALVMCEKAPNGDYCGVQARHFSSLECAERSQTSCEGRSNCKWVEAMSSGQSSYCDIQPTAATLEKVCSPCLSKIANALGDTSQGRDALLYQQYMCARVDDAYCFPLVVDDLRAADNLGFMQGTLSTVCQNSTKERCIGSMMLGAASAQRRTAESSYRQCISNSRSVNAADECVVAFSNQMLEVNRDVFAVDSMCRRNADGGYCLDAIRTVSENACANTARTRSSCTVDCNTQIQNMINGLGCCAGIVHQMLREASVSAADLPVVRNARFQPSILSAPSSPTPPPTQQPTVAAGEVYFSDIGNATNAQNGLLFLLWCSSQTMALASKLHVGCDITRGTTVIERSKSLPIAFDKLNEDPIAAERLRGAMCKDVATAMKRKPSEVQRCRFERDASVVVKTTTTSSASSPKSRRMTVQEELAGTKFLFAIQTTSNAETTAAAAQFDTLVATNALVLPTATAVVADCGCIDATASSLAVQAAPVIAPEPAAPVTPVDSGAIATSTFTAVAVAAAFMLLL